MIDIKFLRENPDIVKENIRKKFQEEKLALVDEVIALDAESRKAKQEGDNLRASKNKVSKEIGALMAQGKKAEAEEKKAEVAANAKRLAELEALRQFFEGIKKQYLQVMAHIDSASRMGTTKSAMFEDIDGDSKPYRCFRSHRQGRQRERGD